MTLCLYFSLFLGLPCLLVLPYRVFFSCPGVTSLPLWYIHAYRTNGQTDENGYKCCHALPQQGGNHPVILTWAVVLCVVLCCVVVWCSVVWSCFVRCMVLCCVELSCVGLLFRCSGVLVMYSALLCRLFYSCRVRCMVLCCVELCCVVLLFRCSGDV